MDKYNEEAEGRAAAVTEVAARLRNRGIAVTGAENPEDLAELLTAVERFEAAVEAHGGDLMVDDQFAGQESRPHLSVSVSQAFLRTEADTYVRPTGRRCSSGRGALLAAVLRAGARHSAPRTSVLRRRARRSRAGGARRPSAPPARDLPAS